MIIFVSDLHLMDETAGGHGLSPAALDGTLRDMAEHAGKANAQHVKLVFLGDILDLIATDRWRQLGPGRPWDWDDASQPAGPAAAVLQGILHEPRNQASLALLQGNLKERYPDFPCEPERVYIPGNHDRLCNLVELRPKVRQALGITALDPAAPFDNVFMDAGHGVFARHGHEWDAYNFEESTSFSHQRHAAMPLSDYMKPPIGDVLTVEVAAGLPNRVYGALNGVCSDPDRALIRERLRSIFDVRPLAAMIPWVLHETRGHPLEVREVVTSVVHEVARDLGEIHFTRQWMSKHDALLNPWDDASKLSYLTELVERLDLKAVDAGLRLAQRLGSWFPDDNKCDRALEDLRRVNSGCAELKGKVRFILYGHTHTPQQRALALLRRSDSASEELPRPCMYLNTGTWRPLYERCLGQDGFVGWKTLTYTIVYQPGEKVAGKVTQEPRFEVWTGGLKEEMDA